MPKFSQRAHEAQFNPPLLPGWTVLYCSHSALSLPPVLLASSLQVSMAAANAFSFRYPHGSFIQFFAQILLGFLDELIINCNHLFLALGTLHHCVFLHITSTAYTLHWNAIPTIHLLSVSWLCSMNSRKAGIFTFLMPKSVLGSDQTLLISC